MMNDEMSDQGFPEVGLRQVLETEEQMLEL